MATNALALEDYYDLKSGGGPAFRSLSIAMFSALLRTACLTVPSWREWCRQLNVAAMQCLPRERWTNGLQYPEFWDSPPFVCNLQSAYQCFVTKPKLRIGALAALHEVCNGPLPLTRSSSLLTLTSKPSPIANFLQLVFPRIRSKRRSTNASAICSSLTRSKAQVLIYRPP